MSFILINKPKKMSSHGVVNALRRITGEKRIGHAGTLDPMAEGLMVLGITRESTKRLGEITNGFDKTYIAEITLGETRDTLDSEGQVIEKNEAVIPEDEKVKSVVDSFLGIQTQTPPIYSALKINGKKAYELARKGKEVNMKPREIEIYEISTLKYKYPVLELKARVSSGTYIRSLARDIGLKLGSGAYLSSLVRTNIGKYKLEDSSLLESLTVENWQDHTFEI